ncbi:MAG: ATP-binding cassette domain-containing protein, partial [Treponema sp.]|nr:ATP-binding cassette domain-containing protein [Treponema sp.]
MLRNVKSGFLKFTQLLHKRHKLFLIALFFMGIVFSVIETAGISVVMVFISIATNPELIETGWYNFFYELLGFTGATRFVIAFGLAIIVFYLFRGIYYVFYNYVLQKFSWSAYRHFSSRLFKTYLALPYKLYIQKNPSVLSQMITGESNRLSGLLLNVLNIFSESFTVLLLYALMLAVNFQMTLALTGILLLIFLVVFFTVIRTSKKLGAQRYRANVTLSKTVWGTLNNYKFIKLKSNEEEILKTFADANLNLSRTAVLSGTLGKLPKSILENLGFSLLIASVCFILWRYNSAEMIIPVISMYALALYRMLPGIIRILGYFNSIAYSYHSYDKIHEAFNLETDKEGSAPLAFSKSIRGENLCFSYLTGGEVIKDVSFEIRSGEKVAFIGESGGGKTTLVDIIIGIHRPLKGSIYVDDVLVSADNIRSWRSKFGYIPQSIYLFDG